MELCIAKWRLHLKTTLEARVHCNNAPASDTSELQNGQTPLRTHPRWMAQSQHGMCTVLPELHSPQTAHVASTATETKLSVSSPAGLRPVPGRLSARSRCKANLALRWGCDGRCHFWPRPLLKRSFNHFWHDHFGPRPLLAQTAFWPFPACAKVGPKGATKDGAWKGGAPSLSRHNFLSFFPLLGAFRGIEVKGQNGLICKSGHCRLRHAHWRCLGLAQLFSIRKR